MLKPCNLVWLHQKAHLASAAIQSLYLLKRRQNKTNFSHVSKKHKILKCLKMLLLGTQNKIHSLLSWLLSQNGNCHSLVEPQGHPNKTLGQIFNCFHKLWWYKLQFVLVLLFLFNRKYRTRTIINRALVITALD